jgi:class 3 adenylate cyclase
MKRSRPPFSNKDAQTRPAVQASVARRSRPLVTSIPPALAPGDALGTVFFCDVVNSTRLIYLIGPDAMRDRINTFLRASFEEVRRYGGRSQYTGDGFMAVFEAPVAEKDHVRCALRAAADVQHLVGGEANAEGSDLMLRIGVHTGPIVPSLVANKLPDYNKLIIGNTTNIAAGLQEAAEPGQFS